VVVAILTVVLSSFSARAEASFPLVPGARWVASTSSMEEVSRSVLPLLARAGKRAAYFKPGKQAVEWEETYGLPVLDLARWKDAGLDATQGWTAFRNAEGEWISASVVDANKVAAWLDRWARLRGLLHKETIAAGGKTSASAYARSKGTRIAAARVVSKDRVLVLVDPDVRSPDVRATWDSLDEVVPASAPVSGAFVSWMRRAAARDVWIAARPQSDGLDVRVRFSGVLPGWVSIEPKRAAWITAAAASSSGAYRVRATIGSAWAAEGADELAEAWKHDATPAWIDAATRVSTGAIELAGTRVFPERATVMNGRVAWGRVFPGWVLLPDRDAATVRAFVAATPTGPIASGWRGRVENEGNSLRIGVGDVNPPRPVAGTSSSPFGDGCRSGHPVLAGRFDGPAVARALDGLTLLGALRDDTLLAVWAIGSELGPLLKVSEPVTVVACAESSSVVDATWRWRFRE